MADYLIDIADRVATVTLNRPGSKNALTIAQLESLAPEIEGLRGRDDVRALVLTGSGGSFSSGADLVANGAVLRGGSEGKARSLTAFHRLLRAVWDFDGPSLAAVGGDAVGFGFDLTLACDLRIAATSARFSQSFSKIALVPDGGSSLMLPRLVGAARAFELMYLAELFDAARALEIGLVNEVVSDDDLPNRAAQVATRLAAGPPLAYRLGKRNLRRSLGVTMEQALANEAQAQLQCLDSDDVMVGVRAWMNKTTPEFTGS